MLTPLRHLDKRPAYSMILKRQRQKQQNQTHHCTHITASSNHKAYLLYHGHKYVVINQWCHLFGSSFK